MAYKIIRSMSDKHQTGEEITAILDSASDLNALGTEYAAGSVALVAASGVPAYMLNASGEWKAI